MEAERKKAMLRIGAIIAVFFILLGGAFYFKNIFVKVILGALAAAVGVFLGRIYISFKRKKLYFEGQCLMVQDPAKKLKRYVVYIKNKNVTKKLYSLTKPAMKKGKTYGLYYEEKSNNILKYEELKFNMSLAKGSKGK